MCSINSFFHTLGGSEFSFFRQNLVEQFYQEHKTTIQPYTNKDISISIDKMNTGKSPDEFELAAEHLKY
jgi:hypothetical protein